MLHGGRPVPLESRPTMRFHVNVHDGVGSIDHEGVEMPNTGAARREAIRLAGSILDDSARRDALGEDWRMEVTDDRGLILFQLDFHLTEHVTGAVTEAPGRRKRDL